MFRALAAAGLFACASLAGAADLCPPTNKSNEWSAQCFEGQGEARRVKPEFVKRIKPNRYGVATIVVEPLELVAVDRTGKILVAGIWNTGDFDYPNAYKGIGRFYPNGSTWERKPDQKCGYFESKRFRIVVPAQYDHCGAFHGGEAVACTDCERYCTDEDCHDAVYIGGQGVVLGTDGRVRRTFTPPSLKTVCDKPELLRLSKPGAIPPVLHCEPGENHPFK